MLPDQHPTHPQQTHPPAPQELVMLSERLQVLDFARREWQSMLDMMAGACVELRPACPPACRGGARAQRHRPLYHRR